MRLKDLSGRKYNRLNVVSKATYNKTGTYWNCVCDCGVRKIVRSDALLNGTTVSCGCYFNENKSIFPKIHGLSRSKLNAIHSAMVSRCYNKKNSHYKNYGDVGVKIYDEWLKDKSKFIDWCNDNGYREGLQIDRINVSGDYEPSNCRFITPIENVRNKRKHFEITVDGVVYHSWEIKKHFNIKFNTVRHRVLNGWGHKEAVTIPAYQKPHSAMLATYDADSNAIIVDKI